MKFHFKILDIFRGIFASMIVFYHISSYSNTWVLNNPLVEYSDIFVEFFFVLSGFVISFNYPTITNKNELNLFLKKRFWRLYPLHLFTLIIVLILEIPKYYIKQHTEINNFSSNTLETFITSLFLLQSITIKGLPILNWNIPSWSVSAEIISYSLYAITLFFLKPKIKTKNNIFVLFIIFSSLLFYYLNGSLYSIQGPKHGFLRGIIGFFTGALCCDFYNKTKKYFETLPNIVFNFLETMFILIIIGLTWFRPIFIKIEYIYVIFFFFTTFAFAFEKGYISKTLNKINLLHKLGKYSYSIYMTHAICLALFNVLFFSFLKFSNTQYSYLAILNYIIIYFVSKWTYKNIELRFKL